MNIKQINDRLNKLGKDKKSLEEKRDAKLKEMDDKRALEKKKWDEKISNVQNEINEYTKALKEQERLEEMIRKAQESADALGNKPAKKKEKNEEPKVKESEPVNEENYEDNSGENY